VLVLLAAAAVAGVVATDLGHRTASLSVVMGVWSIQNGRERRRRSTKRERLYLPTCERVS
jgi:hypothetical protein